MEGQMSVPANIEQQILERRAQMGQNQMGSSDEKPNLIDPSTIPFGQNNQIIRNLKWQFGQLDYTMTHLYISDADNPDRYQPPREFVRARDYEADMRLDFVGLHVKSDPFSFSFNDERYDPAETLVTTEHQSLLMMDKYIQMDFQLPSQRIFGLGERNREFGLTEGTWTMWAVGRETPYDDGSGGLQTYGVHPFVLVQTKSKGRYMGMYFRNSNGQSPVVKFNEDGTSVLSYITTGGVIDVYFFLKASAKQIIQQYQTLIGLPALPPYWALGWHAASYGYQTLSDVDFNLQGYAKADLPLEGVWLDIPYMDNLADFSVNQTAFPNLPTYTQGIQKKGQKMVVIVDAGISADNLTNKYWRQASENNLLIQSSINPDQFNGALTTVVWPNHTVFLDFFSREATEIWNQGLKDLFNLVPFDGLWLDMNEVNAFCDGECPEGKQEKTEIKGLKNEKWYQSYPQDSKSTYKLPFIPGSVNFDYTTMSLNATHPSNNLTQFDTHSIFGLTQTHRTRDFLENHPDSPIKDKRPFILSRSTFPGSGNNTAHWLGDNHREWAYLNYSISGVMNFNMFGIPMVGPDTCGFFKSRFDEDLADQFQLCGRWYQLATFYPFGRHHRDTNEGDGRGGDRNEPYLLEEPYQTWARNALYQRLEYSRHLYSCLFEASFSGQTCFDPLLFHYPNDDNTFEQTEHSFIFANSIKVSPVLAANKTQIKSYFPAGRWVSIHNFSDIAEVICPEDNKECYGHYGQWLNLQVSSNSSDDMIQAHFKPGALAFYQNNSQHQFKLTSEIMNQPIVVIANRDNNGHASGKLFLDDGISLSQLHTNTFEFYEFHLSANSIKKWIINDDPRSKPQGIKIEKFVILDAQDLKETDFACIAINDGYFKRNPLKYEFNQDNLTLTISNLDGSPFDPYTLRDIYYGNSKKQENLCESPTSDKAYYHTRDFKPVDLSKNKVEVVLESTSEGQQDLLMTLSVLSQGTLNIHWTYYDLLNKSVPFEVPLDVIDPKKDQLSDKNVLSDFMKITQDQDKPINILVTNSKGTVIYELMGFVLSQYLNYMEASVKTMPNSKGIIGLFDRTILDLYLKDGVYTLWPRDINHPDEDGKPPGKQDYGVHPMYFGRATDKSWFGVYHNLATAQDWWIKNNQQTGEVLVSTIATGGLGDLYFFFGEDANVLMKNYQEQIIGKPVLTPQWILGWGQCRWGYNSTKILRQIVANYSANDLPLDHQWTDIDYLQDYKDFTYNHNDNFKDLPQFVNEIHEKGIKYVPIIDIGISQRGKGYDAYTDGLKRDIFLKTQAGEVFSGRVWPGDTAFPDWHIEDASKYWVDWLNNFQEQVAFDGIWLDMNEPSQCGCSGACYDSQKSSHPVKWKLPYIPGGRDLEDHSPDLDVMSVSGYNQLDNKVITAVREVRATHMYFENRKQRSMIISRGNFAGLGKYGSRWGGDNNPTPSQMAFSIIELIYHGIMGIPLAGADICGVGNNTTPELCARWHVVGAFYTFSRNHNWWLSIPQEPWHFTQPYMGTISYLDIMRMAIKTKYALIRYYYSEMSMLSEQGGIFIKPMFFDFPDSSLAYEDQFNNVMLGDSLKLSVLSDKVNVNSTDFYFPPGTWCDIFAQAKKTGTCQKYDSYTKVTLPSFAYNFYVHLREGQVVPMQDTYKLEFSTTEDLKKQPVDFHVNLLKDGGKSSAKGVYLNDDGEVYELENNRNRYSLEVELDQELSIHFSMDLSAVNYDKMRVNNNDMVQNIHIYNAAVQGIAQTYSVTAILKNQDQIQLDDAVYQVDRDTLLIKVMQWLPDLEDIKFTKK